MRRPGSPTPHRGRRRRTTPVLLGVILALATLTTLTATAWANGGIVRISQAPVGPWLVTVYSSPTPLRTGEVDISTLVQDSANAIVDVPITVDATPVGFVAEAVRSPATRGQATNKLFKAAKFDIGVPGQWEFRVRVGSAAERGTPGAAGSASEVGEEESETKASGPGGVVSFEAVVTKSTILDRPLLLATLVLLPLVGVGWFLLGRD
ncbi:MAG: hypothetical protein R6U63_01880 [Longimicrobiales bacterium]